ncbi:hypothetical protein Sgly_3279 [Syntrophobotulus glycolicus DSM 8271]|uniref:ATP synthase protein I n=1 Tax=Syntrophobotulus glycolicus (strain DSM 8271 / FlGlyR) TaxID=645991 RepID=F0T2B4_SYNGF|nr:AtpZ/AtpI family protein [Syntrophobotulus glycolicus]ADY57542.1 hypothetical protein Sgly_3279 [Syntrophobotulus glycolicus DSM 8271]
MAKNPKMGKVVKFMAIGSSISGALAGTTAAGYFVGQYLDTLFGSTYIFTLILMLLGVGLGLAYMIYTLQRLGKSNDES